MAFGDNIKSERKKLGITQEQLAEMINVSRQAISKWESNQGYPETEKLILLSKKLNVSIDYLISNEIPEEESDENKSMSLNKIAIMSFDKKTLVMCQSVKASKVFGSYGGFEYTLMGVKKTTILGDSTEVLGWYESSEDIEKEISEINDAIKHGRNQYDLKYYTDVELDGIFEQPIRANAKKEERLEKHSKNDKSKLVYTMIGAGIGGIIGIYLWHLGLI